MLQNALRFIPETVESSKKGLEMLRMELKIRKKPNPNPLKVFEKVNKLKKSLKPIKVENTDEFIEKLLSKPVEILRFLKDGFSLEDYDYIDITCDFECNIPIGFSAQIGQIGANCWIIGDKPDGTSIDDGFGNEKENLIETLENLELPDKIIFTRIQLAQVIGGSSSVFDYKLN